MKGVTKEHTSMYGTTLPVNTRFFITRHKDAVETGTSSKFQFPTRQWRTTTLSSHRVTSLLDSLQ